MAQAKWARCVHQRGADVESFIAKFLAQSHRRVLMIGGAGFDPRSTALASKISSVVHEHAKRVIHSRRTSEPLQGACRMWEP